MLRSSFEFISLYLTLQNVCFDFEVSLRVFPKHEHLRIILKLILKKWNESVCGPNSSVYDRDKCWDVRNIVMNIRVS
jgi:hypothetical protein